MTEFLTIKRVITLVALTAAWCGLWQDVSIANVAAGLFIAVGISASGIGLRCRGGVKLGPLAKLMWLVSVDLVRSTVGVAREILTPTDHTEESIIAVALPPASRDHLLLLVVAITLTPGTAVVDADPNTGTLYLHLLHHDRHKETVEHVNELARLACEALPTRPIGALS